MSYWAKSTEGMTIIDRSLEAPLHEQHEYITPNDRYFVCNSGTTPRISAENHVLAVHGDGLSSTLNLTMDDLRQMPQRTVPALLECAGNHRFLFEQVMGEKLDKRPQVTELMWTLGAVGMAEWRGTPLRNVLESAGVRKAAFHVCPKGGETDSREGEIKIPMPIAKAMDEDTILALEMNGKPLPPDHGHPVRLIVPGWIGAYSVKWVKEIQVSTRYLQVARNTEFYVMKGDAWPSGGEPITERPVKSSLALPWGAKISAGEQKLHGYAYSSDCPIRSVHWSDDGGARWQRAELTGPNRKYGWVRFQFTWQAEKGRHCLMTRASDQKGRAQPDTVPFNTGGYLFNATCKHPVAVL